MPHELRFYADSADARAVGELLRDGLIYGVTTNPTILERDGRRLAELPQLYTEWAAKGAHEIFFQSWGATSKELITNARDLLACGEKVVVKVPATRIGFTAASQLVRAGATVLLTAVYSQGQAVAAATIGVRYIAPYLGRLRDAGRDGVTEVAAMQSLVEGTATDVLAASLRAPSDIVDLAAHGIRYFTAAPSVLNDTLVSPISDSSAAEFEAAISSLG